MADNAHEVAGRRLRPHTAKMHPLLDLFAENCAHHAGKLAARDEHLALTYEDFRAFSAALAAAIAAQTDRPRVGVLAPTSTACTAAIFACWYAGRTPVPLNFMLAPPELGQIIRDADLDLVVTIDRFAPSVQAAGLKTLLLDALPATTGRTAAPDARPHDVAAIIYTSGTTGQPKGACLTFDNLVQNARTCIQTADMTPDHVFLGVLPLFHAFGFTTAAVVPLLLGATVHYLPRFSPVATVNIIAEQRVSVFITIASMFGALTTMKTVDRRAFASLALPVSGGEPLPARVAQIFEERWGVRLYEGYGMTEASPVVSLNTPRAHRAGSVGRPLPGVSVVAVDETGRELPPGHDGQLVIRGHCVMRGYLNQPAQTAATVRDGALWTGDIGRIDPDGFIYITGRAKEMMIVGGENVFPFEIESVLVEHPAVAEAAVIGVADGVRGEVPVAYLIPRPGVTPPTEADLRSFCRDRLAAYKIPRRMHVTDNLPRSPTGKILKRALHAEIRP